MRVLNGFEVEQNPTKSCYKISGKDVPSDFEIRIRFENGKYKAEANYSKKQILEGYLNTINYGGVFGIQNASKYYFNKETFKLEEVEDEKV